MYIVRVLILSVLFLQYGNGFPFASDLVINFYGNPSQLKIYPKNVVPNGYVLFENSLYKYHRGPQVWSKARQICEAEGSYLAIINSEEEALFLRGLMNKYPNEVLTDVTHKDYVLIGFHDYFKEGEFVTINGKSIESTGYVHWAPGQPDNAGGNEDCGSLLRQGGLNDFPCATPSPFICEISSETNIYNINEIELTSEDKQSQRKIPTFDVRSSKDE